MNKREQDNYLLKIKDTVLAIWKEAKILTMPTFSQTIKRTIIIIIICAISTGFFILVGEFIVILFKLII